MKRFTLLLLPLILFSFKCEDDIDFEDNKRLQLTGRIIDINGEGIADVPIEVYASVSYSFSIPSGPNSNTDEVIGFGNSRQDGSFSITTLSPLNASLIYALINFDESTNSDNQKTPLAVSFINELGLTDMTYELDELVLEELRPFTLRVNRDMNAGDTLYYEFEYKQKIKEISFNTNGLYIPVEKERTFGELLPNEVIRSFGFEVRERDTIFFKYRLVNVEELETGEIEIIINDESDVFEFEF